MCVTDTSVSASNSAGAKPPPAPALEAFRDALVRAGLVIPGAVRGVWGRSGTFEAVVNGFERMISRAGRPFEPEVMSFPPVFSRAHYEKLNHIHNFPDLLGSVHAFTGGDAEHRELLRKFEADEDWTRDLTPADVMLIPAACYPLYPAAAGTLAAGGRLVELVSYVFRHEPSDDPARMQIFRQREFVRIGSADQALAHRDAWLEQAQGLLETVGLAAQAVVANDPFFGRGGRVARVSQREQVLKYELVVPITSVEKPTAVSSCNYHLDYFGNAFGIRLPDGAPAHTACVGFGLERVALALFAAHGLDLRAWPVSVRRELDLD